jgi:hypothetical protein
MDKYALHGNTGLPRVEKGAKNMPRHRSGDVGISVYDAGRIAAQLQKLRGAA